MILKTKKGVSYPHINKKYSKQLVCYNICRSIYILLNLSLVKQWWSMPTSKDATTNCSGEGNTSTCSTVFRVEKLEGCCATFRVLAQNPDTTSICPFVTTNSFFTMDLNCLCSIRCLSDTFVDCVC